MRYHACYTDEQGTVRYGIVRDFGPDADSAAARGMTLIEDILDGYLDEVPTDQVTDIPRARYPERNAAEQWIEDRYEEARAVDSAHQGELVAGRLLRLPMADGYAIYQVVKVNPKTVEIAWRGFHPDRWVDQRYGLGGRKPRAEIEQLLGARDRMNALFGRS